MKIDRESVACTQQLSRMRWQSPPADIVPSRKQDRRRRPAETDQLHSRQYVPDRRGQHHYRSDGEWVERLRPGERAVVLCLADRDQAKIIFVDTESQF